MVGRNNLKKYLAPVISPYYRGKGHILMLHRVVSEHEGPRVHNTVNEITPEKLDRIISFYKKKSISIIGLDELPKRLKSKSDYFVVFTFDDGFKDNYTEALPVFESHNAPFTVYVATGFPERKIIIWWYQLEQILIQNQNVVFRWGDQVYDIPCKGERQKESAFNKIRRIVIDTPFQLQQQLLKTAFEEHVEDPLFLTNELAMSWEEVVKLSESPLVTIGAHTINHPALNQLDESQVLEECNESKSLLELKTEKPVNHFAYPFGGRLEVGTREFGIVEGLKFKTATTTRIGSIFSRHRDHLFALPRIPVTPSMTFEYLNGVVSGRENFMRSFYKRVVIA